MDTLEAIVPDRNEYCIRISEAGVVGRLPERSEVGGGIVVLPGLPTHTPDHWNHWLGEREIEHLRKAPLAIVSVDATASAREVWERSWYYYHALVIVTPGFFSATGRTLSGRNREGYIDATSSEPLEQFFATAGTPSGWGVTPVHLREAASLSRQLDEMRERGDWKIDRLGRTVHAFFMGASTRFMDERLHQFCRVLDGFTAAWNYKEFGERVCLLVGDIEGTHREFFEIAYKTRGAVEHLRGPLDAIRSERPKLEDDMDAFVHLAFMAFVMEQIARFAITRLGSTPALWPELRTKEAAGKLWTDRRALAEELWHVNAEVAAWMSAFEKSSARSGIIQSNRNRQE